MGAGTLVPFWRLCLRRDVQVPFLCTISTFELREVAMARADLLTNLVRFGTTGDRARFRKVVEAIIAEERAKQNEEVATGGEA